MSDAFESAGLALAERIAADIRAAKAPPGTVVASAPELRSMHEAGRPVVRQAVRILQERGVAYMRRGAGGGLVVAAPSPAFAGRAMSIVIEHDMHDLMQGGPLPMAIDSCLFLHGAPQMSWEACEDLRRLAQRLERLSEDEFVRIGAQRRLFNAIRMATGEPGLALAQQTSMDCTIDLIPYSVHLLGEAKRDESWRLSLETADALVAGDAARLFDCRRRQVAIFQASWGGWDSIERDPRLAPRMDDPERPEFQAPANRADRLAREILREIRLMGWTTGARIGSAAELMARYGAGPDTLRQAVLMLQEHSAVHMEKGRRGGLYVCPPDRDQAVASAQAYLDLAGAAAPSLQAFLAYLALEAFDGFPVQNAPRLRRNAEAVLARRRNSVPGRAKDWEDLAALCDNPALDLFARVIVPRLPPPSPDAGIDALLRAVAAGDMIGGRRRLLIFGRRGLD